MTGPEDRLFEQLEALFQEQSERQATLEANHTDQKGAGRLSKVTLHRYMCRKGCAVAVIFCDSGLTLCAVPAYKLSPGINLAESDPIARETKALDGDGRWPGRVFDVGELARLGEGAGVSVDCRHYRGVLYPDDILARVEGVVPGHQGKPTFLGSPSRT